MPRKRRNNQQLETRQRIAFEAARIMSAEGLPNFGAAKRKAADRLNIPNERQWPSNSEVEAELRQYQRLFGGEAHRENLEALRREAMRSMAFFARFNPRLVGPVLSGTAEQNSAVSLHLFAESPEEVRLFLQRHEIPIDEDNRRIRVAADRYEERPCLRFSAGQIAIDLTVFASKEIRQAPLSEVDGRPMRRAGREQVEALLAEPETDLF